MPQRVIVWFRDDLRLVDNPALVAAARTGLPVVALYILDRDGERLPGAASAWWLHHALASLGDAIAKRGGRLLLAVGSAGDVLAHKARFCDAQEVYVSAHPSPNRTAQQCQVEETLAPLGLRLRVCSDGELLPDPSVLRCDGYRVFSAYWNALQRQLNAIALPLDEPACTWYDPGQDAGEPLPALSLLPRVPWDVHIRQAWTPGETAAQNRWQKFLVQGLQQYKYHRDIPSEKGTSRMSPSLRFGEVSARWVWHQTVAADAPEEHKWALLREVAWRDFAYQWLRRIPQLHAQPVQASFAEFPWKSNPVWLRAWQRGQTGYPLVDAGMRELWQTGWMHNRIRMVTASFLVKHLGIDWREGERWFWDTLVDADPANNPMNWQWVAGTGIDALPFFRMFNPVLQAGRFDPQGAYVRRFVPELGAMPTHWIHQPWAAPGSVLQQAGVLLGETYPRPLVDHAAARKRTLALYGKT